VFCLRFLYGLSLFSLLALSPSSYTSIYFLVLCVRYVPVHGNARLGAPRTHLEGSAHLSEMGGTQKRDS